VFGCHDAIAIAVRHQRGHRQPGQQRPDVDAVVVLEKTRRVFGRRGDALEFVEPLLVLRCRVGNTRRHLQTLELGPEYQMVLELRPAHDPNETYGFVGVVTSLKDLSASVWTWYREGTGAGAWRIRKVIEIPAEPAAAEDLPRLLKGLGVVPPLVTDLNLSLDDRFLYVSCWGIGELKQVDVSDPFNPVETGSVRLGGIARREAHPSRPGQPLNDAPQMVEISRDGRRVYVTNSLYRTWDDQFYPDGIRGWLAKANVLEGGGIRLADDGLLEFDVMRPHQVHLEGGDAGMRVSMGGLTVWSFAMATAHGAGLMVVPVFMGTTMADAGGRMHHGMPAAAGAGAALAATGLHAVGYLAVTAFVALIVFEKLGLGLLRRAWLNLDLIWAAALVATGVLTLVL
jgi:hypothetical protein